MKIKLFALLLLLNLGVVFSGCVSTVDGHMKAGVPLVKDKIVSRYERTVPQIIQSARVVLARNGQLQADNTVANSLMAKVDTRTVWVKCTEIEPNITEVIVQTRTKMGAADVDLASEISKQIALQLATAP